MLVLSRKESERVKLGDSIILTIVRVTGDRVRLGIEAPDNMIILREELSQPKALVESEKLSADSGNQLNKAA
jgi:carbon storage regulator